MSGLTHTSALTEPLEQAGVTQEAADYAVAALDQFHDFPSRIAGLPDEAKGRSIVYDLNQQKSITTTGLIFATAEDRWDCHVAFIPALGSSAAYVNSPLTNGAPSAFFGNSPADTIYGIYNTDTLAPQTNDGWNPQGLLVICKVQSESSTYSPDNMSDGNSPIYEFFIVEQLLSHTRARLISGGYEVHNVTEELYKGGTVTDYSVDDAPSRGAVPVSDGVNFEFNNSVNISAPPSTLTNATQINGITREAAEGSYVNFKIQDADGFDAAFPEMGIVVYDSDSVYAAGPPNATTAFVSGGRGYTTPAYGIESVNYRRVLNFQQCGSYYTGLSQQTVLNIHLKCQVEVFPVPGSPEMALARESPPHNPRAMEFVHQVQSNLPVAHRVADNGLGDMFRDVLKVANKVSSVIDFPGSKLINAATGLADEIFWDDEQEKPAPRSTPRPRQGTKRQSAASQIARNRGPRPAAQSGRKRQRGRVRRRNKEMRDILRKDKRQGTRS